MSDDDRLRELFVQARAADRADAPDFEDLWPGDVAPAGRPWGQLALAAAVALACGAVLWGLAGTSPSVEPPSTELAITQPQPDVPIDGEEPELMELAAWEPETFDAPTDFLLDEQGTLGGGMPSGIDEEILDFDDLTMEL